mmetsp:Transcript_33539/g.79073  ORF Transcript_33539/g.79073 Transcript_33539/m.79073 type:complete len:210 (-) Transcript_33539:1320-1949(-)
MGAGSVPRRTGPPGSRDHWQRQRIPPRAPQAGQAPRIDGGGDRSLRRNLPVLQPEGMRRRPGVLRRGGDDRLQRARPGEIPPVLFAGRGGRHGDGRSGGGPFVSGGPALGGRADSAPEANAGAERWPGGGGSHLPGAGCENDRPGDSHQSRRKPGICNSGRRMLSGSGLLVVGLSETERSLGIFAAPEWGCRQLGGGHHCHGHVPPGVR